MHLISKLYHCLIDFWLLSVQQQMFHALIDWCLTPTLAILQLYHDVNKFYY